MVDMFPTKIPNNLDELAYWLVLKRIPGLGAMRLYELFNKEKKLSNYFSGTTPRQELLRWCRESGIPSFVPDWAGVEKDIHWLNSPGNHIITWQDQAYVPQLKAIGQSPPVLFVRGQLNALSHPQIAIVGSRKPTPEGKENAHYFGLALAQHGLTITSGLALGIDGASHEGALAAHGCTIAVLGNGLDKIYPPQHKALAEAILARGALVSEFSIGTPPKPENFPQRNRLISGLSLGVLVVESAIKSGSLITANYALDQGREIFVLPGSIHNPLAKGNHLLIRQGAKCIDDVEHILEELPCLNVLKKPHMEKSSIQSSKKDSLSQFLTCVGTACTPMDVMVNRTGLSVTEISSMLLILEMEGKVRSVPGGYVRM